MSRKWKWAAAIVPLALSGGIGSGVAQESAARGPTDCVVQPGDVVGCQPSAFDPPHQQIPTRRINDKGDLDPSATAEQVMAGARLVEEQLGLFRNVEHLHWVPLVPSILDPATGQYAGGDMDGEGSGRALTIIGQCLFAGHSVPSDVSRDIQIFRLSEDPIANAPVQVSSLPMPRPGMDDTLMSGSLYTRADGTQTITLIRDNSNDDGALWAYEVDPETCLVTNESEEYDFGGDFHEFGMWIDPQNEKRVLIVSAAGSGSGRPDPLRPGQLTPDIRVIAITDETTGYILPKPITLAQHSLQEVGGPVRGERPDATGLFADGRYPDYTHLTNLRGTAGATMTAQNNTVHQATFSADGERIYVAGGVAGFYVINSEAIAHNSDADLAAGTAGCNFESTNVYVDGVIGGDIDGARLGEVVNDCLHMVVNDDPGVQELIAQGNFGAYFALHDRSRFDPFPPILASTGMHSAIAVPNRPSLDQRNDAERPAYIVLTTERPGAACPTSWMYILSIEMETFPTVLSTFGVPQNEVATCLETPMLEPDGVTTRRNLAWQNHNPTVFENLIFVSWYGQGVRVIDISNPFDPREVGHAVPAPAGVARSYPVVRDGLFYWVDNDTGLHVARYTGPRADELPQDGRTYEGNTTPHF